MHSIADVDDDDVAGNTKTTGNRRMSERDLTRMGGAESTKSLGPLIANSHPSHSLSLSQNLNNSHNNTIGNSNSSSIINPLAAHLPNSKSVPALHHHTGSGTICK